MTPPNSDAVVWAASTAPAARSRTTWVESNGAVRSAKTSEASVNGHPATGSSSLTPMGTPPKGRDTSAAAAWARAASGSRWLTALRPDDPMAARDASSASVGLRVPARKASTSEQASSSHGSVMARDVTPAVSRPPGRAPAGTQPRLA